jgi:hypothetical protein
MESSNGPKGRIGTRSRTGIAMPSVSGFIIARDLGPIFTLNPSNPSEGSRRISRILQIRGFEGCYPLRTRFFALESCACVGSTFNRPTAREGSLNRFTLLARQGR